MTEQLELDIEVPEPVKYHAILEAWLAVLSPAREVRKEQVTIPWAVKLIAAYPGLGYPDIPDFARRYFDLFEEVTLVLEAAIELNPECLKVPDAETDAQENRPVYMSVILDWQKILIDHEMHWRPDMEGAAAEVAALTEVNKVIFEKNGIIDFLDQIDFELTEADQALLRDVIENYKAARDGA